MKKNLRIVSAAAAALLAVAPVAATAVPAASTVVSAATYDQVKKTGTKVSVGVDTTAYTANAEDGKYTNSVALKPGQKGEVVAWPAKAGSNSGNWVAVKIGNTIYTVDPKALNVTPADDKSGAASENINAGSTSIFNADGNTAVNITAVAKGSRYTKSSVNGQVVATVDGKQFTALLHTNSNGLNATIHDYTTNKVVDASNLLPGHYWAQLHDVTVNLGNSYAGKSETFTLDKGIFVNNHRSGTKTVTVDNTGVAHLGDIAVDFYALNGNDLQEAHYYAVKTGNVVTSGSVDLHAVNGRLNVTSVYNALTREYQASQLMNYDRTTQAPTFTYLRPVNDLRDQLTKAGIKVDPQGYFTAPSSFSLTLTSKSNVNGAEVSLPVTVNVDNVTPAASQETTRTVKIMHIATIYDKNGKATHEPALRAYNTVSVVSDPVSLKDEKGNDAGKFYKLAGKDQYIKVGNVDGTSRSLKHNSYVYKSTGKRRGKTVLKKGSSVTTYGKSFMIAGHQMYRIGENQYVKKANF